MHKNWRNFKCVPFVTSKLHPIPPAKGSIILPNNMPNWDLDNGQHFSLFDHGLYPSTSFSTNGYNEHIALCRRAQKETPKPDMAVVRQFSEWVKKNFISLFPGFKRRRPVPLNVYLANSNASPQVKKAIATAGARLADKGITCDSLLTKNELYDYTRRKAFIKVENNLYSSPAGTLDKPPRLIQGAQPEFVALVGPCFMALQSELKKCWTVDNPIVFASGVSSRLLAESVDVPEWRVFMNDVSSYDASICYELGKLEVWMAQKMGARRAVCDLMEENLNTHGVTSKGIKYKVKGTRKSGDPYTTYFNSILNALMHVFVLSGSGTIKIKNVLQKLKMLVAGDDNLLRHSSNLRPDWRVMTQLGFKCDNIYVQFLEQADFCSARIYNVHGGKCFGPMLGRVVNKLFEFNNPPLREDPFSIMKGVCLGMRAASTVVPFLWDYLKWVLVVVGSVKVYGPLIEEWKMLSKNEYVDEDSRTSNELMIDTLYHYGFSDHKIVMARVPRQLQYSDWLKSGVVELLYDRDTAAPKSIFMV